MYKRDQNIIPNINLMVRIYRKYFKLVTYIND